MSESCIDEAVVASTRHYPLTQHIASCLAMAAAPTFAAMAIITALSASDGIATICGANPSWLGGMVPMYLLMGIFHSAPWLTLIGRRLIGERTAPAAFSKSPKARSAIG
jgi:hypothetical protein